MFVTAAMRDWRREGSLLIMMRDWRERGGENSIIDRLTADTRWGAGVVLVWWWWWW